MKWSLVVRLQSALSQALVVTASTGLLFACKPTLLDPSKYLNETVGGFLYSPALLTIQAASAPGTSSASPSLPSLSGATVSSYSISPALTNFPFLSFNTATGEITQTGTAPSSIVALQTFTVSASTDQGTKDTTIDIQVLITIPAPTLTYSPNPKLFPVGTSSFITPTVGGGGSNTFSIPAGDTAALTAAGLTFDPATGTFSGSATSVMAARVIQVTASNLGGSATFAVTVEARAAPTITYSANPKYFTVGQNSSISPTFTGTNVSFSIPGADNSALTAAGLSFSPVTGDLGGTATIPMASRTIVITASNEVGSSTFSLTVAALVAPVITYSPATKYFAVGTNSSITPTAAGTNLVYSISGADNAALTAAGLAFDTSTGVFSGSATSAMASRVITVTATNGVGSDTFPLTVEAQAVATLTYFTPTYFTVGVSSSLTPTASGSGLTFSIPGPDNSALAAAGLAFNTSTGVFSGSATSAMASRVITVTASNSVGSASFDVTIEAQAAPTLSYVTPKYFTVGVSDSVTPTVTGTNVSLSISGSDNTALTTAGLSFSVTTGVIGGTATAAMASRVIVVTASNSVGSVTFSVTVEAQAAATISYSPTTKYFAVGVADSITPSVSGTSVTYSIPGADNSALVAAGLAFSTSTGAISGTASATMASRTITVTATNLLGSTTANITVMVFANPTKLILSGATTGLTTDCITYTMQTQDSTSTAANVTADRTITLGGAGTNGTFYSGAGCTGSITSLTVAAGTSQTTFYYKKTSPGAVTLTGTSAPLTAASLAATISVAPPTAVTLTGTLTPTTASCAAYTITTRDSQGNASQVSADTSVALSDGAAAGDFYATAICNFGGGAVTTATVLNGASTAVVYYKMPSTGPSTLSANVSGIATGTLTINVGISTAAKLSLSLNPSTAQPAGTCIEVTIKTRDAGDNLIDLTSPITVNLTAVRTSDGVATGTFYSTAGCSGAITSIGMASGTQSQTVYYVRTATTVPLRSTTLTAAKSGGGFANGTATIDYTPGLMFKLVWETVPAANTMQAYNLLNWSGATTNLVNGAVCSRFRLKVQDQYNNDTTTPSSVAVTLAGEGDGAWYDDTDTDCNGAFSGASFASGALNSNYFRYRKPTSGSVSFTASASGAATTPASVHNVSTGTPDRVAYNNPPTTAKAGACTAFTLEIRDSSNIIIPAPKSPGFSIALSGGGVDGTFHSANTCTVGNQITSATITAGTASRIYYFKKATASAPSAVTINANETTTLTDAADRSIVVSSGAVTNIAWTTAPTTYNLGTCQTYTITARDENNLTSNPGATININLSTSGGGADGTFHSANTCTVGNQITSTSIGTGASSVNVFYRKPTAGSSVVLTADATGWITQTRTVTGITVNAPATTPVLSFTGAASLTAGTCSPYTVSRTGATTAAVPVTLSVTGGATGIAYYVDAACTLAITSVNLSVGSSTTNPFYVMGAVAESGNLRATATSHTTGNRALTIN